MQIAHIRSTDKQIQSLSEHTWNTAKLCSQNCEKIHLENTGYLVGLLHDMGKANHRFEAYLQDSVRHGRGADKGSIHHAPVGAIYAYETWYHAEDTPANEGRHRSLLWSYWRITAACRMYFRRTNRHHFCVL